jgi:hypothetical protein
VSSLLKAISDAATWDEQVSEGKSLSEREEAVLQSLELMTREQTVLVWIRSALLREQVAGLLGQPVERLGDAQWIGHILKGLHLLDETRRRRSMEGMIYAIQPAEVSDMMHRYNVAIIKPNH